jgi:hypothetical protein
LDTFSTTSAIGKQDAKSNELSIPGLWRKQPECLTGIQGAVLVKPWFDAMPEAIALIS